MILEAVTLALGPGLETSFQASGGVEPYSYAVAPGGAGGTIDAITGEYKAPASLSMLPSALYDKIIATDADLETAEVSILVAHPLLLFCEIIQKCMGLAAGRVYLWDQKIKEPKDQDIYVVVSVVSDRPFGSKSVLDKDGNQVQVVNQNSLIDVSIKSMGPGALYRKEEILMALASFYSQAQQERNSFRIGKLPSGGRFVNLSTPDGAAIPYQFNISVQMQYGLIKSGQTDYFDDFSDVGPQVKVQP